LKLGVARLTEKPKNRTEPKPKFRDFLKTEPKPKSLTAVNPKRNISGISSENDVKNQRKSQKLNPFCQKTQIH